MLRPRGYLGVLLLALMPLLLGALSVPSDAARGPAPSVRIMTGPGDRIASRTVDLTYQASQSGVRYQVKRDRGRWSSWSPSAASHLTGFTAGSHQILVRAKSRTGRVGRAVRTRFLVDLSAPQTGFSGARRSATVLRPSSALGFDASEKGSTFTCKLDRRPAASCTSPFPLTGLSSGAHRLAVQATDPAGNVDATAATRTFTVDDQAPQGTLFSDDFETGDLSRWTVVTKSGGTAVAQTGIVRNGAYAAQFLTTSAKGSAAYARTSLAASVTDPTTAADVRVDVEGASGGNVPLLRVFDDAGTRVVSLYRQNGSGAVWVQYAGTYARTTGVLPLGTWTAISLKVTTKSVQVVMDGQSVYATNSATLTAARTIQIGNEVGGQAGTLYVDDVVISTANPDTTPPQTTITSAPNGTVTDGRATIAFSSSESGSTFQCSLDSAAFTACTSPQAYSALPDGQHTFAVAAVDPSGNVDPTPATTSWTATASTHPALLIADNLNRRILITDYSGTVLWKMDNPTGEASAYSGPLGLRWTSDDKILATFGTGKVGEIDPVTKTFIWKTAGYNQDWFQSPYDAELLPDGRLAVATARNAGGRVQVYDRATGAVVWTYALKGAHLVEFLPAGSGTGTAQPTLLVGGYAPLREVVYDPGQPDNGTLVWTWQAGADTHRAILDRDGHSIVLTETDNLIKVDRPNQTIVWNRHEGNPSGIGEARGLAMTADGYALGWRIWNGASMIRFTDAQGNVTGSFSRLSDGTSLNLVYAVQALDYPG